MDLYWAHERDLHRIHLLLSGKLGELTQVKSIEAGELKNKAVFACRARLWRHHAESAILFPHLRRAGKLKSSDVSFLDIYDRKHVALHTLCERLLAVAEKPRLDSSEIALLAADINAQFTPHIAKRK